MVGLSPSVMVHVRAPAVSALHMGPVPRLWLLDTVMSLNVQASAATSPPSYAAANVRTSVLWLVATTWEIMVAAGAGPGPGSASVTGSALAAAATLSRPEGAAAKLMLSPA